MKKAEVCILAGDGIGPEVTREARAVVDLCAERFSFRVGWSEALIGGAAIDAEGTPLPPATLERARGSDAVLLGAVGGPKWDDPRSTVRPEQALLGLRRGLELFGNLRPIQVIPALAASAPLRAEILAGVDILFVRELTGGVYFG
ncbi:MAG TPA: isocitrate/isopropylmalate family dehydrogenase, partial [Candidatus Binatia bacterium]|nr:isocitrate/isopropylmalate family dehydrogenase [Candidatus Binatia bacterium]